MLSFVRSSVASTTRNGLRPLLQKRGIQFMGKDFAASSGFSKYSEQFETHLAEAISTTPASAQLFQKPDGSPRNPEDKELQQAAAIAALTTENRATLLDKLKMSDAQAIQFQENTANLETYFYQGRRILDKIPIEDPITGKVSWQVIREGQKEGWESIIYYLYVPGLVAAAGLYFFLDNSNVSEWALEELRLRAQEKHGDKVRVLTDPVEQKKHDDLIVERIISGEYDKLAGLRKKSSDLPSSLL